MTLFWDKTGPFIKYSDGLLQIEDLNPHLKTQWRMSRVELLKTGFLFLLASFAIGKGKGK